MNDYNSQIAVSKERLANILGGSLEPARRSGLPQKSYVSLTEALTWMAFGEPLNTADFSFADQHAIGPFADQGRLRETLGDALMRFSDKGSAGDLKVRGRYVATYSDHNQAAIASTEDMLGSQLRDFARFDSLYGGLERGTGLTWEGQSLDNILHSKCDGWRDVEVRTKDLLEHFGSRATRSINPGPVGWDTFPPECLPELERLNGLAMRDEWWTWPEAFAWVGSRDSRNIATLRQWAVWWRDKGGDTNVILGAQDFIARSRCASPSDTEADLINAIERGAVGTSGRLGRDAKSIPLDKGDWRGGTVVFDHGTAELVSAGNPSAVWACDIAVNRADLTREFSAIGGAEPLSTADIPTDDCILKMMKELKAQGFNRDAAAKHIRKVPGFEAVGNEHARRVAAGQLTRGRPRKRDNK